MLCWIMFEDSIAEAEFMQILIMAEIDCIRLQSY